MNVHRLEAMSLSNARANRAGVYVSADMPEAIALQQDSSQLSSSLGLHELITSATTDMSGHQQNLARRMQMLIRAEGSMASIARRCGFSEGAVRSWRDGNSDISRERCVVLARTLNISLIWLITGEGPMRSLTASGESVNDAAPAMTPAEPRAVAAQNNQTQPQARARAVNPRVLAAALRLLQSYIGLLGGSLNPLQRADALAELYDILAAADEPDHIDRLIAFHITLSGQVRRGGSLVA